MREFAVQHVHVHAHACAFGQSDGSHDALRQLNMYSFSKTRHDANWREFKQELFQRGRRDLLPHIKRKTGPPPQSKGKSAVAPDSEATAKCVEEATSSLHTQLDEALEEIRSLKHRMGVRCDDNRQARV